MPIANYINEINKRYKTGISREHSYRGDLQTLIEKLATGIIATNEPARIKCGAPDYVITKNNIPLGYIEAKDLDDDLDNKNHKEQFDRYRNSLNNLIITNYLEFRFYRDGEKITTVRIGHIENDKVVANTERFQEFNDLIVNFCAYRGQTIHSASKLAKMMAGKARLLADVIKNALNSDDNSYDNRTLQDQMTAFKKILINDIKEEEFADVYAQTIAYGMFAGRLNDTSLNTFSRQEACECIPKSNPFLRNLFSYIAGPTLDDRIKWIVDDLADVFVAVNLHDILKDFGKATKTQDPIIHFYETFLSEYDPKLRKSRGVWYTPQPVVNFIVCAVDDILKQEFGLSEGLADTSKIKIKIKDTKYGNAKSGKKSAEIEKEVHRVQILDPATGTGTFLAEVIRQIHEKFIPMQGMWSSYVEQHLLPRVHGFEILMASYAMAHLKLDLILKETGYKATKNDRLKVYLTNSLEEPHPDSGTLFASWLSQEAEEANEVKRDVPVMVVLGNPPYSGESLNNNKYISDLIKAYKKDGNSVPIRDTKWVNNDYVKFTRYAEHFIERNNNGIVAYITSNSFLDRKTFRGMRYHLLETFNKIFIINLHGYKKGEITENSPDGIEDENVFDIQEGVSINIFIKNNNKKQLADVFYNDLYGNRTYKYDYLVEKSLKHIDFIKLNTVKPYYFFIPKDFSDASEYDEGFKVSDLFMIKGVGICSKRDPIAYQDIFTLGAKNIKSFYMLY
ncbi:MAG: N-6 DNA methylase [Alphaproteobacteria bacterium]|nr:N-6 DNA methylase [Alphaproteobacteria bacterium]